MRGGNIEGKVREEIDRGWLGPDRGCAYYPCHFEGQDCTFCYCPFYPCNDPELGEVLRSRRGGEIWNCTYCLFIHRTEVCRYVMSEIERMGIADPDDPRLAAILPRAKERFFRKGKALMVLGATSDAGKSVTVAAICRILHDRGFLVAPFKSQNMSLDSRVAPDGAEIAMIQVLQAQAAGLRNPDRHMNPILLKPRGDTVSQVIVEGEPFGEYDVRRYYEEFVPVHGEGIVRRNLEFLKERYDFVIMEGAGSPAEINIYDSDIANMKAARIADADCLLVVNTEWGGSFAYAVGTVGLIPAEDRRRIKGIVLNNVRGGTDGLREGAAELERLTGIPVIGIIPHADVRLPSEDSGSFRDAGGCAADEEGRTVVAVVRFPRISHFSDCDPLAADGAAIRYVDRPGGLDGCDAVVIPGSQDPFGDLEWMRSTGIADRLAGLRGSVPVLGICGGYQMMGRSLVDRRERSDGGPRTAAGLGFFDCTTVWDDRERVVRQVRGDLPGVGPVSGYEVHAGRTETEEPPLFRLEFFSGSEPEGSKREEEMLFGTYLHGCLDKPAFRGYLMSFIADGRPPAGPVSGRDHAEHVEEGIAALAAVFEAGFDLDRLLGILGAGE